MKKLISLFVAVFTLLVFPIYANTAQTISLNHFSYKPIHTLQMVNQTTYISLDDILRLTYSTSSKTDNYITLNFNGLMLKSRINSRVIQSDTKQYIMLKPIVEIDDVVYFPLEFFTALDYPLQITESSLDFTSPVPYSTSTDRYVDHTKINVRDYLLTDLVCEASTSPEEGNALIKDAIKNNHYLVLPYKSPDKALLNAFKTEIKTSLPMEVVVREGDFLNTVPHLSGLKTLPITLGLNNDTLTLKIEDTLLSPTCFEVAFNPSAHENVIDSEKTVDALLMRLIYTYYRDYYALKDDLNYSPISNIEMKRSDFMRFGVYSDHIIGSEPLHYEMTIAKQMHPDRISYVVDFSQMPN